MRLVKDMYNIMDKGLFELRLEQMRMNDLVHNGNWYNQFGEKLGWGDLAPYDMRQISENLEDDELFVIVSERDGYWDFVSFEENGDFVYAVADEKSLSPGVKFLGDKWKYIISAGRICIPESRHGSVKDYFSRQQGLDVEEIPKKDGLKMLKDFCKRAKKSRKGKS